MTEPPSFNHLLFVFATRFVGFVFHFCFCFTVCSNLPLTSFQLLSGFCSGFQAHENFQSFETGSTFYRTQVTGSNTEGESAHAHTRALLTFKPEQDNKRDTIDFRVWFADIWFF